MSPTPVTFVSPTAPSTYTWEATDDEVAERYGVERAAIVRFDLNTSPAPPDLALRDPRRGAVRHQPVRIPAVRLPAARGGRGGPLRRHAGELLVGAGADEILDLVAKAFLRPGIGPSCRSRRMRCTASSPSSAAPRWSRSRGSAGTEGWALDLDAVRAAAAGAAVVWLCSPNNPTALPEPDGTIERLLEGLAADAGRDGRPAPIVVLDEAYAEFVGRSLLGLRTGYPNLIVVRTASKAYALAGLRVGFAIADPAVIGRLNPYRPPGSVSTVSVTVVADALADDTVLDANLERVRVERERLAAGLTAAGWAVGPSVTNFLLADLGSPERAAAVTEGLLRRGLVPRTFPAGHPLAGFLRLTVRAAPENDRIIQAANEIARETQP